ncbi:amino acid ABC transporter permease [Aquamicrobium sp. LC103]|uniref:amino acid ABC transporter permease n=1 Tax=Aquamicrobium sp. LC103 TaxID=1120658 RepID=UPI00063E6D9F|nr:amino acid ABC transporter permease [Aquamicrobium sp. LC103]TKT69606.1 amino acid ABC transporter permease [Aquamicrobium sp. LC103]
MGNLNFRPLWRYQDAIIEGIVTTLWLTVIATLAGLVIGTICALVLRKGPKPVRYLIYTYIEIIRNTPPIIQIFIVFFVFPGFGVRLDPFPAASIALSLYFGAYASEIIRSGLDSIPRSQVEAGHCLGLSGPQVFFHVVLAPALRNIYPSITSQFVLVLLGTSIASQISTEELFHTAGFIDSRTFRSFEVYALVALIYVLLVTAFRLLFALIGKLAFRWPTRR